MRKLFIVFLLLTGTSASSHSQIKIGLKAGLNFANVTNAAGINAGNRTGYMIGGFISSKAKKIIGFRSEILLSRQGYDYKTNRNTGTVNLDYLLLPQLITINFTKKFEVHAGGQIGFLLNANVDSTGGNTNNGLLDYFNRFNYCIAGGMEIKPIGGLFIGARINVSLSKLNGDPLVVGGPSPNYIPKEIIKNNVVQLYAGWRL